MTDEKASERNASQPPPAASTVDSAEAQVHASMVPALPTGPLTARQMGGLVISVRYASKEAREAAMLQNPLPPWLRERNGS